MVYARAKTKTTKRRKVWVTWQSTDGGGGGCGPNLYVDTEKAAGAKPFVESRPGDVVLSREEAESLRYGLEQVGQSTPRGSDDANRISDWIALLRGGR